MLSLNTRVHDVRRSASVAIADRVRRLETSGAIISLQTGDPDFDTRPAPSCRPPCRPCATDSHYTDSRGLAC
jgi:aspartate/methionine/tyrosine aminotransferase